MQAQLADLAKGPVQVAPVAEAPLPEDPEARQHLRDKVGLAAQEAGSAVPAEVVGLRD
jgi:hypothetical protein